MIWTCLQRRFTVLNHPLNCCGSGSIIIIGMIKKTHPGWTLRMCCICLRWGPLVEGEMTLQVNVWSWMLLTILLSFFFVMVLCLSSLTGRFTRHLNIISIDTFDDETLSNIFTSITDWHFSNGFDASFYRCVLM